MSKEIIEQYQNLKSHLEYYYYFQTKKQKEEFFKFFNLILFELTEYATSQGLNSKLAFVNQGIHNLVYGIGDKIIKIGYSRREYEKIPYCEHLLQPIMNREFIFDGIPMRIEVTEKVKVLKNKDSILELINNKYELIAKELKSEFTEIGLKSHYILSTNVGILLKDNTIHYANSGVLLKDYDMQTDAINVDVGEETITSITNNNNLRVKKKGEFVLIDFAEIEIADIDKYSNYLRGIGLNEDAIQSSVTKTKNFR